MMKELGLSLKGNRQGRAKNTLHSWKTAKAGIESTGNDKIII